MQHGFVKVAAGTPYINIADCIANREEIERLIGEMQQKGAKIMVFPELCITGYTCGDLFEQERLLEEADRQLIRIAEQSQIIDGFCS